MKTLEELKAIRESMQSQLGLRNESSNRTRVVVGMATCGIASGARPVLTTLSDAVQQKVLPMLLLLKLVVSVYVNMSLSLRLWSLAKIKSLI